LKELDANIITQLNAQGRKPVALVEIYLDGLTLRYAANIDNIIFPYPGGNTYTAKAVEVGDVSQTLEGQIGKITVKLDNTAKDMFAYVNSYTFEGKKLVIKRVFLDSNNHAPTASTEYIEVFSGTMDQPREISRNWITVAAHEGKPLPTRMIQNMYEKQCQHAFGDAQCNKDGYADLAALTASGTADSGTTSTLVDSILTQADDYWNYGAIEITKSGTTYKRKVKDFVAATDTITFDLALPVAVDNTCTYQVWKGCPKSWDDCQANNNYGPIADNKNNFGGFIHIGMWRED
jgi:hypothetical protein